jgi:hypothetical protein
MELPVERWHTTVAYVSMASYQVRQYAFEGALHDHMGIFQHGTHSGPRLAHVAVGLLRCGYPHLEPWPSEGQAVWIESRLTRSGNVPFFDEWHGAVRETAIQAASWVQDEPFMAKREFVAAVLEMAGSIVRDTYGVVGWNEVRSACSMASVAPQPDDANAGSSKKRQRGCDHRQASDRSVDESADSSPCDMTPFYRAVLYPQDGNQDAGGLVFSLEYTADEDQTLSHLKSEEPSLFLNVFQCFSAKSSPKQQSSRQVRFGNLPWPASCCFQLYVV